MENNKAAAGYHILMILSHVDGHFSDEESEIAARYISRHFNDEFNLERETHFLKSMKRDDYFFHFQECMDVFYSRSSAQERAALIKFAVDMVKADNKITNEENSYLNALLTGWEPEHTG